MNAQCDEVRLCQKQVTGSEQKEKRIDVNRA
jgi:hypothetical protein